jgi:transcriptional regulator GlxA family with amidase domain
VLFQSLAEPRKPAPAHRALAFLEKHAGAVRLDDLARATGVSKRQFRRLCIEYTGLPPKLLARMLRFRRAVGLRGRGLDWAQLALECGYFDQAHLVRDFREFSGGTPSEALQK